MTEESPTKRKKSPAAKKAKGSKPSVGSSGPAPEKAPKRETTTPSSDSPSARKSGGTDLSTKLVTSFGVIAAMVLAVVLNVLSSRHYERYDLTAGGQFTLSAATKDTIGGLQQPVKLLVLLSKDDPLGISVEEILESYQQHSSKLEVEHVDPDRNQARLLEIQKKYGVLAGERQGRVVTDTAIVAVAGDRHHYVSGDDLVKVESADDMRQRPQLEYAITSAIRHVLGAEKPKICFSAGHDEPTLEVAVTGLAELGERLAKNNFEVTSVFAGQDGTGQPDLSGCRLLVLPGPRSKLPRANIDAMKSFIEAGGDALLVVGPVPNPEQTDWVDLGAAELLALAGVAEQRDLIFEQDPALRPTRGDGEAFFPKAKTHPATLRLLREEDRGVSALFFLSSSLRDLGGDRKPEPLLVTSDRAVGVTNFWQRSQDSGTKSGDDHPGPLAIATATELPAPAGKPRGARIIVISAISPIMGGNWRETDHFGTTLFVEGSIAWLTEHQAFLDIPDKPLITAGLKLTQDSLQEILRYVVFAIPLMVLLPGIVILWGRRRKGARAPAASADKATADPTAEEDA